MEVKTIASFECGIIEKEYQLVGQSITANFPKGFPDAAIKVQMDFERRMDEIANSKSKQVLFSPYMSNGIFATYFASLEVDELNEIPDGMMGLELPLMKYAKICCSNRTIDQGYSKLFAWMGENGYKQNQFNDSCPIEIFYLENGAKEEVVEILIPIH
ncbi:effector binding domain-containing protein [Sporosarcina thermotolerans]|uniref:Effector binding domain-containing protein n=1 Tax=Sporosarcina thermotolerans TaxID=633404 RepID=A0AAW9A525_9BACL|nr:effector binding domain-containing protein [Sporosarcina thermotolerans]MDW0115934.1 effector binding domain-containing protein [Sporosarcina thermotolerans]